MGEPPPARIQARPGFGKRGICNKQGRLLLMLVDSQLRPQLFDHLDTEKTGSLDFQAPSLRTYEGNMTGVPGEGWRTSCKCQLPWMFLTSNLARPDHFSANDRANTSNKNNITQQFDHHDHHHHHHHPKSEEFPILGYQTGTGLSQKAVPGHGQLCNMCRWWVTWRRWTRKVGMVMVS